MKIVLVSFLLSLSLALPSPGASALPKPVKVKLKPRTGLAGSSFVASGSVARGESGVRIFWDDGGTLRTLAEAVVDAAGKFVVTSAVPADAAPGLARVCAIASGPGRLGSDLGSSPFLVEATPPGGISGQATGTNDVGAVEPLADAMVLVKTADGGIAYTNDGTGTAFAVAPFLTDATGNYNLGGLQPGNYLIEISKDGYSSGPTEATVPAGEYVVNPLPYLPKISNAQIGSVGAIALNTGALSGLSTPVIVSSYSEAKKSGVLCRFGSLPGVGAEVRVRFWADAVFPAGTPEMKRAVRFEIRDGSANLLWSVRKPAKELVSSEVPLGEAYTSNAAFEDVNVSEFPPDLCTLRVTPLVDDVPGSFKEYLIQMTDLKTRWFPCWISGQQIKVGGGTPWLRYDFTGYAPSSTPNLLVNLPIDLVIETFQNQISANVEIHERYDMDGGFSTPIAKSKLTANVKLMSSDIVNNSWPYSTKVGSGGTAVTHTLKPFTAAGPKQFAKFNIYQNGPGIGCVPVCVLDCSVCAGWKVWVDFKLAGSLQISSTIHSDLSSDVYITPAVSGTLGGHVRAKLVICGLDANVTGTAQIGLPFHYETAPCPGSAGFESPCVQLSAHADADFSCLDIGIGGGGDIGPYSFGNCANAALAAPTMRVETATDQEQVDESPTIAADGQGGALALWVEQDPEQTHPAYRLLRYARFSDNAWGEGQSLSTIPALVNQPSVAFLAPDHALAIWAQNQRTPAQIAEDGAAELGYQDIYVAHWDGATWTAPEPITEDEFADGMPRVAADPNTGRALAVWIRHNTDNPDAEPEEKFFTLVSSVFSDGQWSAPAQIAPSSPSLDFQPSLAFDHDGNAWVAWTRDEDGDPTTFADRMLMLAMWNGTTWDAPETIPGTPPGAFSPSLAIDQANQPLVVFTEPPYDAAGNLTSGLSNRNQLWSAWRRGRSWELALVGDPFYAEEPVLAINPQNQAIIMFRRFADDVSVHRDGDLAAAVGDLNAETLAWNADWLSEDGQTNWKTAFAIDPESAMNFVANVKLPAVQNPSAAVVAPTLSMMNFPNTPDLAIAPDSILPSEAFPVAGNTITLSATILNRGLGAVPAGASFTVTFYEADPAKRSNKLGKAIGSQTVSGPLLYGQSKVVSVPYTLRRGGLRNISAAVQPGRGLTDPETDNNVASTTLGAPFTPAELVALSDSLQEQISLLWEAPFHPRALTYRVYRSTTSGSDYEMIGATTDTTFTDSRAAADTTYYYVVAAVDDLGVVSAFSNEDSGEWSSER